MAIATPFTAIAFVMPSPLLFFAAAFCAEIGLFLSTSPVAAIGLRSVPPAMRASAMAAMFFAIHRLGDLWSPSALGALADALPGALAMMAVPLTFGAVGVAVVAAAAGGGVVANPNDDRRGLDVTMPGNTTVADERAPGHKTAIGTAPSGSPERVELARGTTFRGLRIRALLGAGGMGNAYLASHESLRTPVVIKLFKKTINGDPLAEAHLAARVVSSQVVPVLDAGVEQGLPYVMQRYVDGIDLEELLAIHAAAGRPLPMSVLLRIAVDVLRGLSAIHVAGVVHRDIKPPNLFLAGSGEALVGDFGIAVDQTPSDCESVAGTPMFIAPELWAGSPATARSDLYATAATLHLLWQRRPPFVADTVVELADLHRDAPYVVPSCEDPVAAYFGAVLARMLAKHPSERPESALGVARQLERIATPRPELRWSLAAWPTRVGDIVVHVEQRDLCTATTDVVVSASNEELTMRRGVANALRLAGGDLIEGEAQAQGPITMGQVVWTGPGALQCKAIAHAAAALDGAICIQRSVLRTLFEAERRGYQSVTFPALGTGIGEVPHGLGARLLLEAIRTFASFSPRHVRAIHVALPTAEALAKWTTALVALDADAGQSRVVAAGRKPQAVSRRPQAAGRKPYAAGRTPETVGRKPYAVRRRP